MRSWRLRRAAPRVATWVMVCQSFGWLLLAADLPGLARLAADLLPGVSHDLALVGLGLATGANLGRDLADQLLVDADHGEPGRARDLERRALRRIDIDGMAVA